MWSALLLVGLASAQEQHVKDLSKRFEEVIETRVTFRRLAPQAVYGALLYKEDGKARVPVSLAVPFRELTPRRTESGVSYRVNYLVRLVDGQGAVARKADAPTLSFKEVKSQELGAAPAAAR